MQSISKRTFLDNEPFTSCLRQEVEFMKTANMNLLVDPLDIYFVDTVVWNDSMAYLSEEEATIVNSKSLLNNKRTNKSILKCGFLVTGRPKKVWALKMGKATIQEDAKSIVWYQVDVDMLITKFDDLLKFRNSVQCALKFGVPSKPLTIPITGTNAVTNRTQFFLSQQGSELIQPNHRIQPISCETSNDNTPACDGEFCCAGEKCGMALTGSTFIACNKIKHKCVVCEKAVHGGICGAEACTILAENNGSPNGVICFLCISIEQKNNGKTLY